MAWLQIKDLLAQQEQKNLLFTGSIFALDYQHKENKSGIHPGLYAINGNTMSALSKLIKGAILNRIHKFSGLWFYEIDMKNCHFSVLLQTGGKTPKAEFEKARSYG